MLPDERDAAYLWDMLDAARTVQQFTADRLIRSAVGSKKR